MRSLFFAARDSHGLFTQLNRDLIAKAKFRNAALRERKKIVRNFQ